MAKFFKGADLSYLDVMMKQLFADVYVVKPQSSRASSAEAFVVGLGFTPGKDLDAVLSSSMMGLKEESKTEKVLEAVPESDEEADTLTF